jgi:hypothetical protein
VEGPDGLCCQGAVRQHIPFFLPVSDQERSPYQVKRGSSLTACGPGCMTRSPATHGAQLVAPRLLWYRCRPITKPLRRPQAIVPLRACSRGVWFPLLPGFIKAAWLLAQGHAIDTLVLTKSQPTAMDCAQTVTELRTSAMATADRQPIVRKRYFSYFQQTGLRPAIVGRAAGPADGRLDADRVGSSIAPGTRAAEAPATHEPKHA